jgi:predicted Rossmann fold flavoprotein
MMAAGRASELGARVLLLEKNQRLGIKLLVTGNGRCNVTNNVSKQAFIDEIWPNGKFLHSSLHAFGPAEIMEFLEGRGLGLQTEEHNRVFPKSNRATDVLNVLKRYLDDGGVTIMYGAEVVKFHKHGQAIESVLLSDGRKIRADNFIIATGGKSFPETGSTGLGYVLAKSCGHRIVDLRPALTSIEVKDSWARELEGISLAKIEAVISEGKTKLVKRQGDLIFTSSGVSGPVIFDLSGHASLAGKKDLKITLNMMPQLSQQALDERLRELFHREGNKQLKNGLSQLLPSKMAARIMMLSKVDGEKKQNEVTREERQALVGMIRDFSLTIDRVANIDRAYVTAGGVSLAEVHPKTMQSTLVDNLYFAGEILDLTGPTGGFNLQITWTTGYAAGSSAAK